MTDKRAEEQKKIDDFVKHFGDLSPEKQAQFHAHATASNEAFLQSEFVTPDILYVDLDFFRDTKLGTVMTFVLEQPDREAAYQEFRKGLKTYQIRLYDEVACHFPTLGFTEEEFRARHCDPSRADTIFRLSPATQYILSFKETLGQNVNHSQVREKWTKRFTGIGDSKYFLDYDTIHMFINTWPVKISHDEQKVIGAFFNTTFKLNITCICTDPLTMPVEFWSKLEDITTFHLKRFMDNDAIYKHVCQMTFSGRYFFAPLIIPREAKGISDQEFKRTLSIHTDMMRLFYHFHWIQSARFCVDLHAFGDVTDKKPSKEEIMQEIPSLYD